MAMHFIGANYGGTDLSKEFINCGAIGIGFSQTEAAPIHAMFSNIAVGDIVVMKAYSPLHGLFIKGIGICCDNTIYAHQVLNTIKKVKWFWHGNVNLGTYKDYFTNMRTGTLYVEYNTAILEKIIDMMEIETKS